MQPAVRDGDAPARDERVEEDFRSGHVHLVRPAVEFRSESRCDSFTETSETSRVPLCATGCPFEQLEARGSGDRQRERRFLRSTVVARVAFRVGRWCHLQKTSAML